MKFNPGRFLQRKDSIAPEHDPQNLVFGFGRRICPGRFFANLSLFLTIAKSLAVFNIAKISKANDTGSDLSGAFLPGMISHPFPFHINVCPCSEDAGTLINSVETEDPWVKGDPEVFDQFKW
jgi:hypothetical protein